MGYTLASFCSQRIKSSSEWLETVYELLTKKTAMAFILPDFSASGEHTHMKLDSLKKLYIEELRDLFSAENQIVKALPKMAKAAKASELKEAFRSHLEETKNQVTRLTTIFESLGVSPKGKSCKAMEGLLAEGAELMKEDAEPEVLDAGLIAAAQRVEHYEMAGYGTVRTYARLLGESDAEELLQETLDEEGNADHKLTDLAEQLVNAEAMEAGKSK